MKLNEDEIRKLTLAAINELGEKASPDLVKKVVSRSIENYTQSGNTTLTETERTSGRIILTSFGMNHPGIVAKITKTLSDSNCDIQDISQKLMGDYYTMILLADITNSAKELKEIQEDMSRIADELRVKIYLQHEDLFRFMHRI